MSECVAGGAAVALALAVWGRAKSLRLLDRPKHWLRCNYVRPHDVVGFPTVPHFVLEYENRGNVPVVFSDFFLLLPRLEGVLTTDGAFISHPGADLLIDKRPSARIGSAQAYRIMDYRTNKVRLEPGDSHTDFFDLEAFVSAGGRYGDGPLKMTIPHDFSPVLTFHDQYGNAFYADPEGIHGGAWRYPHQAALEATLDVRVLLGVETKRSWLRWFGWTERPARGLREEHYDRQLTAGTGASGEGPETHSPQ